MREFKVKPIINKKNKQVSFYIPKKKMNAKMKKLLDGKSDVKIKVNLLFGSKKK